ncbi:MULTISPECIES: plasmid partitioning protein [unclassified Streptomyces]|uniref:plasmid partitioning protein n=1 Tax=unclassified Streptomyces TaxID=2593676 RepID=UPI00081F5B01|nr:MULTISPECIES: plasmid partitioning protein [unclassified Streptomyces]MYZ34342.1 plasmid partitioning protein [Streptomyces sp. SID4917]SCF66580.1 chromosome partitioning protein, ParB family [Streptomyces sp. MnatMP-M17]
MSVADRLGTGASFSDARRGRSARGRAKAVAQGDVPVYELVRLRLDEVSPTPLNPRRNFGTDEDKLRFGEELRQAQLAACVAVTRSAYLALWPDHADRIGEAGHVLVNGERRFHSAVHVGLDTLDFVVRDDLASSREEFINHLLKENLEREDFDVIERARGVEQLVAVCAESTERGARTRAAERLSKDRSWVTNQLVLLELPTELQTMLSAGTLAERDGRSLARYAKDNSGLDAAALLDHLKASKDAMALAKAEERIQLQALRAGDPSLLSADNNSVEQESTGQEVPSGEAPAGCEDKSLLSTDNKPVGEPALSPAKPPAQRQPTAQEDREPSVADAGSVPPASEVEQPRRLPYDDAFYIVQHLHLKMTAEDFARGARVWLGVLREQQPAEYVALVRELTEHEQLPA